jgi:hypothetical protein
MSVRTFISNNGIPMPTAGLEYQSIPNPLAQGASSPFTRPSPHESQIRNLALINSETMTNGSFGSGISIGEIIGDMLNPISDSFLSSGDGSTNRILPNMPFNGTISNIYGAKDFLQELQKRQESEENLLYERITGLSQERPEILMLTDFQPLFRPKIGGSNSQERTDAGLMFEHQVSLRNLKCSNIKKIISFNYKNSPDVKNSIENRRKKFKIDIEKFFYNIKFFTGVINDTEIIKRTMDVRGSYSRIKAHSVMRSFLSPDASGRSQSLSDDFYSSFLPEFDAQYALSLFGYSKNNVTEYYSNTKTWLQLLLETKAMHSNCSLRMFDIATSQFDEDKSLDSILKIVQRRFDFMPGFEQTNLTPVNQLREIARSNLSGLVSSISNYYPRIYKNLDSKDKESGISAIINQFCKICKYSFLLNQSSVRSFLSDAYGYSTEDAGNLKIFDSIYGQDLENINDPGLRLTKNSLMNFSHKTSDEDLILNLEPHSPSLAATNVKYGGNYYIDSMLGISGDQFDVSRAKDFLMKITSTENAYSTSIKVFDFLGLNGKYYNPNQTITDPNKSRISDSLLFLEDINSLFLNGDEPTSSLKNDPVVPLLTYASSNAKLKSLLFLYVMLKSSNNIEISSPRATAFRDESTLTNIIQLIKHELLAFVRTESKEEPSLRLISTNPSEMEIESIINSLESDQSSAIFKKISTMFRGVHVLFSEAGFFSSSSASRYGRHIDTFIYMVLFDIIIKFVDIFGAKRFVDKSNRGRIVRLLTNTFPINRSKAKSEINARLKTENMLEQHGVISTISLMRTLKSVINKVINTLTSESAKSSLTIKNYFKSPDHFKLFLRSENQLSLLSNQLTEILHQINMESEYDQPVAILNNAEIKPRLKTELDNLFSLDAFANSASEMHKILSVGIPHNVHNRFKSENVRFDNRAQDDIIKLLVYKTDAISPEIIFKPKTFLFEMSRYPVAGADFIKSDILGLPNDPKESPDRIKEKINPPKTIWESIARFATRDRSQVLSNGSNLVQYISPTNQIFSALVGADYDFLSTLQKEEIYKNHILSYVMEMYLKIMTGVNINEFQVEIDPNGYRFQLNDFIETLLISHIGNFFVQNSISKNVDKEVSVNFFNNINNLNFQGSRLDIYSALNYGVENPTIVLQSISSSSKLEEILPKLTESMIVQLFYQLGVIADTTRSLTNLASPDVAIRGLCGTKYFDRVFNVVVDSQDFYIDVEETCLNERGRILFEQLLATGDIQIVDRPTTQFLNSIENDVGPQYRLKKVSKDEIVSIDRYFVAIEAQGATGNQ